MKKLLFFSYKLVPEQIKVIKEKGIRDFVYLPQRQQIEGKF